MAGLQDHNVDIALDTNDIFQGKVMFEDVQYANPTITIYLIANPKISFQYDFYYSVKIKPISNQYGLPVIDLDIPKTPLGLARNGFIEDLVPIGKDNPESKSEAVELLQ